MNSIQNDQIAKEKAKNALVLNKVKPNATPESTTGANKKIQPMQKTRD